MAHLSINELRSIGRAAAQALGGDDLEMIEAKAGQDASDEPAYFISYRMTRDRDPESVQKLFLGISHRVRDTLIERGDEHYPYVRLLGAASQSPPLGV